MKQEVHQIDAFGLHHPQQPLVSVQKPVQKRLRRTRQPRNPQLSVARRNERERNRVKMVNNGFALLRDHLPVEDLAACEQQLSSSQSDTADTPTPDGKGSRNSNNKKFSKVETLRLAIQHIRKLEELMRSTEPGFQSMNIGAPADGQLQADQLNYDETALSCNRSLDSPAVKLEIAGASQAAGCQFGATQVPHQYNQIQLPASPNSQHSGQSVPATESHQQQHFSTHQPAAYQMLNHSHDQYKYSPHPHASNASLQQHQHGSHLAASEHTHIWLAQHQSSFLEQQQQASQQEPAHFYTQQHQVQSFSDHAAATAGDQATATTNSALNSHLHMSSPGAPETPLWFNASPASTNSSSLPMSVGAPSSMRSPHHSQSQLQQQHYNPLHAQHLGQNQYQQQISLYSQ